MASFPLNSYSLRQDSLCLISLTFSRYNSMLNTCKFHFFVHSYTHLPLKTSLELKVSPDFVVKKAHASVPKSGTPEHETSTRDINLSDSTETGTGYSSVNSIVERVTKKSGKTPVNSLAEEKAEKRFSRNVRKTPGYRKVRGINSRHSSESSKDDTPAVSEKMEKKDNKNLVGKGNKSKKDKDSPLYKLRLALDQCCKRGDVMGALSLYDSAQREGIKLGQYHYTVLLYLCSSAAFGVSNDKNMTKFSNMSLMQNVAGPTYLGKKSGKFSPEKYVSRNQEDHRILVSEDIKKYVLQRGFEIYENLCLDKVSRNEKALISVARMAMSVGDGDMAFEMVKQMKSLGINPRLRSYGPALTAFSNSGDVDKAFAVEKHMLEHGVSPEEPELEALLRVSVGAGQGDKVYYLLHKLRTNIRKVSPPTADVITDWFNSEKASELGKRKWDKKLINEAIENNGGGWHGQGWLGRGKWKVSHTNIRTDGICECCGSRLATIDVDPIENENFAKSVASIVIAREKNSNFQEFQKWLDNYGPLEAVIDGANVGFYGEWRFVLSRIDAVADGIRQKLLSKSFPLIILNNNRTRRRTRKNRALIDKWKNANALYATPNCSHDDWYWLYAAIKFKCLLVTNDEMRDHIFQLLGNDFFAGWKERHQVRFSFSDAGPEFHMPPSYSVVIQRYTMAIFGSRNRRMGIGIFQLNQSLVSNQKEDGCALPVQKQALCGKILQLRKVLKDDRRARSATTFEDLNHGNDEELRDKPGEKYENLRDIFSASVFSDHRTLLSEIEAAELLGGCTLDFQI